MYPPGIRPIQFNLTRFLNTIE
ncbi:hypothetical protein FG05_35407 [Fusarium graminearum]|nr:hypothetical protein FG05_35407 [Fusarium graminearum]